MPWSYHKIAYMLIPYHLMSTKFEHGYPLVGRYVCVQEEIKIVWDMYIFMYIVISVLKITRSLTLSTQLSKKVGL